MEAIDVISEVKLRQIMPYGAKRTEEFAPLINAAMREFDITTKLRIAAFLAQVAHESGELRYLQEIASGVAYEGRADLGNTEPGDGPRFKGRGLLQITGRANYRACGEALGLDLIANPAMLATPAMACRSAGWFWATRKLNALADNEQFVGITRRINGGTNGIKDRENYYARAKRVLNGAE